MRFNVRQATSRKMQAVTHKDKKCSHIKQLRRGQADATKFLKNPLLRFSILQKNCAIQHIIFKMLKKYLFTLILLKH